MWPFKKKQKLTKEMLGQRLIELADQKDVYEDRVIILEKRNDDLLEKGKKTKVLSEKKRYARQINANNKQIKSINRRITILTKQEDIVMKLELALDEINDNKNSNTADNLLNNPALMSAVLTDSVALKEYNDEKLLETERMFDNILDSYSEPDELYGDDEDLEDIVALMSEPEVLEEETVVETKPQEETTDLDADFDFDMEEGF